MSMKHIAFKIILVFAGLWNTASAQINFFEGTFREALTQAKKEKKAVFIDFYAHWCEPCKIMEKEVFSMPEVGEYLNRKFVCCKLNVEAPENKETVQTYQVSVLPTMLFLNEKGEVLRILNGVSAPDAFIREAMIATGEALSFEQLYNKAKKNKKDLQLRQELLTEAPAFFSTLQGYERQKWGIRIETLFEEYLAAKTVEHMDNPEDFMLLVMFHPQKEKNDPIFDALIRHYPAYVANVGKAEVDRYIIGLFNSYIISLCRNGKSEYKQELERLNGDLGVVYGEIPFGKLTAFEAINLLADGYYNLYRKNTDLFFDKMNQYFDGAGEVATANNYTMPVEDLFSLYQGKIPENAYPKVIPWLEKSLEFPQMSTQLRARVLCLLGECYKEMGNLEKAKQCFNQAFLVSAEVEDKVAMVKLQQMIKNRLENL